MSSSRSFVKSFLMFSLSFKRAFVFALASARCEKKDCRIGRTIICTSAESEAGIA